MRVFHFIPLVLLLGLVSCNSVTKEQASSINTDLVVVSAINVPVLVEKESNDIILLQFNVLDAPIELSAINVHLTNDTQSTELSKLQVNYLGKDDVKELFGESSIKGIENTITGSKKLSKGLHHFKLALNVNSSIDITKLISIVNLEFKFSNGETYRPFLEENSLSWRIGNVVRAANQDNCHTYRIPGLVTTNEGTLIAVYDNRYNNSKDLQEDIDVGMSRSVDGGQTWEPMKVIMDMGEWGGQPQQLNGIGDPCVLYDHHTHTIWVAALWLNGSTPDKMAWWDSKPGMKPSETGQFVISKSTDDGLTWSEPINITDQIKDPAWQLLLQGPGRGITLEDGTLVFPAQFKADIGSKALDGGPYTCHSTIVYSKDQGNTWQIGTGAKDNTTEAQVATLSDGSLMLNMRDDRNRKDKSETNGRAIAVTKDFGKTWEMHVSSNSVLQESNCMASLISAEIEVNGEMKHVLFFSNPNNKQARKNMTIKASFDNGKTWPYELELNENDGFGYSCLSIVDEKNIGILYEGVRELYFQKITIDQIITKK
ncbi:exo-alpha-sialidase [Carboxylicivirga sp. N1Y90]|uniref:exo-alpha-sialidase n=1 Tax=Carboxylicivirga fragile TaxID=3417571 RepID=UPI003D33386B|nr:exo-alpha-sialidase [Marinilabiliaceae bacterium N1Y90]